ncbi:MAG: autotransporter outer membrane beta-barrel domain-containing protein [Planctomycetota bacterium]|nr:autotransporter outer membrane beta-barrel domain-containing protein [Planctomycetota bacterium]
MAGTLDLSGTTQRDNNLFLANGDVTGTITTGGGISSSLVFIGNVDSVAGNGYSWRDPATRDDDYELTDLHHNLANSEYPGMPVSGASTYFSLDQISDTTHLNVKEVVSGGGELHVKQTSGNLYNLKGGPLSGNDTDIQNITTGHNFPYMVPQGGYPTVTPDGYDYSPIYNQTKPGDVPNEYTQNLQYTHDIGNGGDYLFYSILNQDAVNVGAIIDPIDPIVLRMDPAKATIGAIKDVSGGTSGNTSANYDNSYGSVNLQSGLWMPKQQDIHDMGYYLDTTNNTEHPYYDMYNGHQAQITAGMVNVFGGSKLTIHPNFEHDRDRDLQEDLALSDERNIIGNLNIVGIPDSIGPCDSCGYSYDPAKMAKVTIDRTTLFTEVSNGINPVDASTLIRHGIKYYLSEPGSATETNPGGTIVEKDATGTAYAIMDDYRANVVVGTNGYLQGWSRWAMLDSEDHSPVNANIVGDVAVLAGGTLRPYDDEIFVVHGNALHNDAQHPDYISNAPGPGQFDVNAARLKGVQMSLQGDTYMEHASRLSTRLFSEKDGMEELNIVSDGKDTENSPPGAYFTPHGQTVDVQRYWGDSVFVNGTAATSAQLNFDDVAYASHYLQNGLYNWTGKINATIPASPTDAIGKDIWTGVAQHNKVQYVPVFGFVNELKSKLEFDIYKGDDQSGDQTYYYQVIYGGDDMDEIRALKGMDDANHLFNRDIVFSDMLGNWSFQKQADDKGVALRYRMLAKHPQDGGIAIDEDIRNSKEAAYKLDEIRYPFLTNYNMHDPGLQGMFHKDPSLDGNVDTPYDQLSNPDHEYAHYDGNPYDQKGYNGDIKEFYGAVADPGRTAPYMGYGAGENPFTNYKDYWVKDIENYFRALQLNIGAQSQIHLSIRLLTAEPYASQVSSDLAAMNRFIDNRERNGMSALWLVEEKGRMNREAAGEFQAPLEEDMPTRFVQNPMRVWATVTGNQYSQKDVGDEYGYRVKGSGLQLGVIKEIGDAYFGLTGAYNRTTAEWSDLQADNKSDNFMAEALVGIRRGRAFLELSANAGYMDHDMTRDLTHGTALNNGPYDPILDCDLDDNYYNGIYSVKHFGDWRNRVLGGGLRLGYQKVIADKWLFLPTIGVRFQDVRNPKAVNETGKETASFKLIFDKGDMKRRSLQIPVMFRLSRGIAFNDAGPTILTPEIRVGAVYEAMDRGGVATYQWCGNPIPDRKMKAWGIREDRLGLQAGVTLEVSRRGRFYAALNYDTIYRDKGFNHNVSFQGGVSF